MDLEGVMSAIPALGSAHVIRSAYQGRLLRSLASLLCSAERGLSEADFDMFAPGECGSLAEQFARARRLVEVLDWRLHFAPTLYALHATLHAEMLRGEAEAVIESLEFLARAPASDLQADITSAAASPVVEGPPADPRQLAVLAETLVDGDGDQLRPSPAMVERGGEAVCTALELLSRADAAMAEEVEVLVSHVSVLGPGSLHGMTDVRVYGRVHVRTPRSDESPVEHYLEHLVHETSHLRLHALMSFAPLIENSPGERFAAPIRADERPMFGVFHAAYVLSRLVHCFRRLPSTPARARALARFEAQLARGLATVEAHAALDEWGMRVLASMRELAANSLAPRSA